MIARPGPPSTASPSARRWPVPGCSTPRSATWGDGELSISFVAPHGARSGSAASAPAEVAGCGSTSTTSGSAAVLVRTGVQRLRLRSRGWWRHDLPIGGPSRRAGHSAHVPHRRRARPPRRPGDVRLGLGAYDVPEPVDTIVPGFPAAEVTEHDGHRWVLPARRPRRRERRARVRPNPGSAQRAGRSGVPPGPVAAPILFNDGPASSSEAIAGSVVGAARPGWSRRPVSRSTLADPRSGAGRAASWASRSTGAPTDRSPV